MAGTGHVAAILLTLLCAGATAARDGRALDLVQPVRISTNSDFSVFDCDFKASEMLTIFLVLPMQKILFPYMY